MQVRMDQRDFSKMPVDDGVDFEVDTLTWSVYGGCKEARIKARGSQTALWNLVNRLRCPVTVSDDSEVGAWWGFANKVELTLPRSGFTISLDNLRNAVKVSYSLDGAEYETDWSLYQPSIDEYGRRELIYSLNDGNAALAAARQETILEDNQWPDGHALPGERSGTAREPSAVVHCRGWWSTLDWRYALILDDDEEDTTAQISNIIATYGQFLTGTDIAAESGYDSVETREGDESALKCVLALMGVGGANGRRLLSSVTAGRRAQIYEMPARSTVSYLLNEHNELLNLSGLPAPELVNPCGRWARVVGMIPPWVDTNQMANPGLVFIEGASYKPGTGLKVEPRGKVKIEDLFRERI